jgi:hypothetical protein
VSLNSFSINEGVVDAVVTDVTAYGQHRLETGGFFMANIGEERVTALALAGDKGIFRRYNLFQISERALDRLFTYADASELWLPIQYHSHMFEARMSLSDQTHGLNMEGFVSTILPNFSAPPRDPATWGWSVFDRGRWNIMQALDAVVGDVSRTVIFDEDGVRER